MQASRKANTHSVIYDVPSAPWQQAANIASLFSLDSMVGQGIVGAATEMRVYSLGSGLDKMIGPVSYDDTGFVGRVPMVFSNTYTPNAYPDTFAVNIVNVDPETKTFYIQVGRTDQAYYHNGWGDNDIRAVYTVFNPRSASLTNDVLAIGALKIEPPVYTPGHTYQKWGTYSNVTLHHNLNRTDYQCFANVRVDAPGTSGKLDRTLAVECQHGTDKEISFMVGERSRRRWDSVGQFAQFDNVYVQYLLVPAISQPTIAADHFSGVPTIVGR
jgi:hypothetical protein